MKKMFFAAAMLTALFTSCDGGKEVLFNGQNLDGWVLFVDPTTDVKAEDVFSVKDGVISITGMPYGYMRTTKKYADYVAHAEFRWTDGKGSNSGFFQRVQEGDKIVHLRIGVPFAAVLLFLPPLCRFKYAPILVSDSIFPLALLWRPAWSSDDATQIDVKIIRRTYLLVSIFWFLLIVVTFFGLVGVFFGNNLATGAAIDVELFRRKYDDCLCTDSGATRDGYIDILMSVAVEVGRAKAKRPAFRLVVTAVP